MEDNGLKWRIWLTTRCARRSFRTLVALLLGSPSLSLLKGDSAADLLFRDSYQITFAECHLALAPNDIFRGVI